MKRPNFDIPRLRQLVIAGLLRVRGSEVARFAVA